MIIARADRRSALAILILTAAAAPAAGQPDMNAPGPMGPMSGSMAHGFVSVAPGDAKTPGVSHGRLASRVSLATTTSQAWSVQLSAGHFALERAVPLSGGAPPVPTSLSSLAVGVGHERALTRGKTLGLSASVGSDSDKPFHGIRETTFQLSVNYRVPADDRSAWMFLVSYANNRYFLGGLPLPGVGYQFETESGHVRCVVGFPMSMLNAVIAPRTELRLTAFGPRRVSADLGYSLFGPLQLHGGYDLDGQTWLLEGRGDRADQLNYERKRLYAGLRSPLARGVMADLTVGREYDRRLFVSRNAFRVGDRKASLSAAWAFAARLMVFFGRSGGHGGPDGRLRGSHGIDAKSPSQSR